MPITFNEYKRVISLAKSRKSVGIDVYRTKFSRLIALFYYYVPSFKTVFLVIVCRRYVRNQSLNPYPKTLKTTLGYLQIIGG